MQASTSHGGIESRVAARTNLFLAATMQSGGIAHPVKIRDLSASGARIETPHVFEVGDAVTLIRGRLSVDARVSWRAERFCGLSFNSPVSIQDWMLNSVMLERQLEKSAAGAEGGVSDAQPVRRESASGGPAVEQLRRVSQMLATLGDALGSDPGIVFRHGTQLYNLGLAARTLDALAKTLEGEGPDPEITRR